MKKRPGSHCNRHVAPMSFEEAKDTAEIVLKAMIEGALSEFTN